MKRLPALLAALVVVALVGGVAAYLSLASGPQAYAAGGEHASQQDVDRELKALAGSRAFAAVLKQSGSAAVRTQPGTMNAGYTAGWLTIRIAQSYVDQTVAQRHVQVTSEDRANGPVLTAQLLGSDAVVRSLPRRVRNDVVARFTRVSALTRVLLANPSPQLRDAALAQCPSHRFVSHILVQTLAEAQALKAQLAAGADFATLATQNSIDQASAVKGGQLGCLDANQFVSGFQEVAQSQPIGVVSDPVQTQFGFHLILVLDQPQTGDLQSLALSQVLHVAAGRPATVDPRYGTWDRRNGRVVPPNSPPSVNTVPSS